MLYLNQKQLHRQRQKKFMILNVEQNVRHNAKSFGNRQNFLRGINKLIGALAIEIFEIHEGNCDVQGRRSTGAKGEMPLAGRGRRGKDPLKSGGKGGKSVLLMLSINIYNFSHFLLTFVLSGSTSFYPQEFMACHEIQQWLGA